MVCMASLLSSNGRISAYFDNIRLKLFTNVCFKALFYFKWSKQIISKNEFYDVITNELYIDLWPTKTLNIGN